MSTQGPGSHWLEQVQMKRKLAMSKSLSAVPWDELSAPMTGASLDSHSRHCRGTENGKRYCANLWKIQPARVTSSIYSFLVWILHLLKVSHFHRFLCLCSKSFSLPEWSPALPCQSKSISLKVPKMEWVTWSDLLPKNILLAGWCGE